MSPWIHLLVTAPVVSSSQQLFHIGTIFFCTYRSHVFTSIYIQLHYFFITCCFIILSHFIDCHNSSIPTFPECFSANKLSFHYPLSIILPTCIVFVAVAQDLMVPFFSTYWGKSRENPGQVTSSHAHCSLSH